MEEISSQFRLVLSTCDNLETARHIAEVLVEKRLAACVNILPGITSIYKWQGDIQHDIEVLLLVKTHTNCLSALETTIRELHTYELPEIINVPISGGLMAYLNWITQSVQHND